MPLKEQAKLFYSTIKTGFKEKYCLKNFDRFLVVNRIKVANWYFEHVKSGIFAWFYSINSIKNLSVIKNEMFDELCNFDFDNTTELETIHQFLVIFPQIEKKFAEDPEISVLATWNDLQLLFWLIAKLSGIIPTIAVIKLNVHFVAFGLSVATETYEIYDTYNHFSENINVNSDDHNSLSKYFEYIGCIVARTMIQIAIIKLTRFFRFDNVAATGNDVLNNFLEGID